MAGLESDRSAGDRREAVIIGIASSAIDLKPATVILRFSSARVNGHILTGYDRNTARSPSIKIGAISITHGSPNSSGICQE